jgi:hypothetical protein
VARRRACQPTWVEIVALPLPHGWSAALGLDLNKGDSPRFFLYEDEDLPAVAAPEIR